MNRLLAAVLVVVGVLSTAVGALPPTDPYYYLQWHLVNTASGSGCVAGQDINVYGTWTGGNTGTGVQVAVVDDGLPTTNPDLSPNFVSFGSYDFNKGDFNPSPENGDQHGTACAGLVGAKDDGVWCGVGVAFDVSLAGIRVLGAPLSEFTLATALNYEYGANDIYSNSYGPPDDLGMYALGDSATALENGAQAGRNGKGSIFVWAAGNGGQIGDNCGWDGFVTDIHTIAVGASSCDGKRSYFSESCAALFVNAPGLSTTTTLNSGSLLCTDSFSGTSAACPVAAGAIALIVKANPTLTWRDVQHVIAHSAERTDTSASSWQQNAASMWHSQEYGFGRIDVGSAVTLASTWTNVLPDTPYDSPLMVNESMSIPEEPALLNLVHTVSYHLKVEHVEVTLHSSICHRGALLVLLVSPSGTESILQPMHGDRDDRGIDWTYMSVQLWDEDAFGVWSIRLSQDNDDGQPIQKAEAWQLRIHGTKLPTYPAPPAYTPARYTPESPEERFARCDGWFLGASLWLVLLGLLTSGI